MKTTLYNCCVFLVIVIVTVSVSGCYTILRHPDVTDEPDTQDFSRCSACHEYYHHPGPYDAVYGDPWLDYYMIPWWYDDVEMVTEEGEAPVRRFIYEGRTRFHDSGLGINPTFPSITPPVRDDKVETDQGTDEGGEVKTKERKEKRASERSIDRGRRTRKRRDSDTKRRERNERKEESETDKNKKESKDKKRKR
ncbi:MAG: hypothetical protein JSV33_04000 [bacterium]|nr:MAG: hypothetical protein JSV33_04000 [bacterium]